jgi:hypothetical protein
VLAILAGCASTPPAGPVLLEPIDVRVLPGAPALRDGRAGFRSAFCDTLGADSGAAPAGRECDRWLWRLPDEPAAAADAVVPALQPQQVEVVLVTGAFSECVGERSRPLAAGADRLQAAGARVRTITVSGRSGVAHNAAQIAAALSDAPVEAGRTVILVGYSKGGLDILRFLVDFPDLAADVDAMVSIATPVFGTPLADLAAPAYRALLASLPLEKCPPGDGEVMASLEPAAAVEWLSSNPLPPGVRYYSLAAFAARDRVARALVPSWKHLGGERQRNDGQVLAVDAVIPGGTLLGFARSDHWGIALTTEMQHPTLLSRPDPEPFPLEQLLVAVVTFVAGDPGPSDADPPHAPR